MSLGIPAITIDGGGDGQGAHATSESYDDGDRGWLGPQWAALIIAILAKRADQLSPGVTSAVSRGFSCVLRIRRERIGHHCARDLCPSAVGAGQHRYNGGTRCPGSAVQWRDDLDGDGHTRQEPVMVERSTGWLASVAAVRAWLVRRRARRPWRRSCSLGRGRVAPSSCWPSRSACSAHSRISRTRGRSSRRIPAEPFVSILDRRRHPPIVGLGVKDNKPTRLKLGSGNVAGYGMWRRCSGSRASRSATAGRCEIHRLPRIRQAVPVRRPARTVPVRQVIAGSLSAPLYSQIQRFAWSATYADVDGYQTFIRGEDVDPLSLEVARRSWAAQRRVSLRRQLQRASYGLFAGAQVGGDRVAPAEEASSSPSRVSSADPDTTLGPRYRPRTDR